MSGDIEDNFIGKLLVQMKSNFNKSPTTSAENESKLDKEKITMKIVNKADISDKDKKIIKSCINEKNAANKKSNDVKVEDKNKCQKRTKNSESEGVKRLKVSPQIVSLNTADKMENPSLSNDVCNNKTNLDIIEHDASKPDLECNMAESKEMNESETTKEIISNTVSIRSPEREKTPNDIEMNKEAKEIISPGRRSLRLKTLAPEITKRKDNDNSITKRSPRRRSKDYCESVLANAIARKEKSYEHTNPVPQQRLSRRIKPTAKVLANRELRLGIEMQNDARSSLSNDISKKKSSESIPEVSKITNNKTKVDQSADSALIANNSEDNNGTIENVNKKNLKQMQEKHLGILGLKAVGKNTDEACLKSESNTSVNSRINNSKSEKNSSSSVDESKITSKRNLRDRCKKQPEISLDNNTTISPKDSHRMLFKKSVIPHSSSFAEDESVSISSTENISNIESSINEMKKEIEQDKITVKESNLDNINQSKECSKEINELPDNQTNYICHCHKLNKVCVSLENRTGNIHCGAVDSVDNRFIGCTNCILDNGVPVESKNDIMLLRASPRLPYLVMCSSHASRLRQHLSCSGCGGFCTQGSFIRCANQHLYHRQCSIVKNKSMCPHCGIESPNFNIEIMMKKSFSTVFLPTQDDSLVSARMSFTSDGIGHSKSDLENRPSTPPILNSDVIAMLLKMKEVKCESTQYTVKDLYKAIRSNDYEKLILAMASDIGINSIVKESTKSTALHEASELGHMGIIHILVVSGAELDVLDLSQKTPLMAAIMADQLEAVQYLIKAGSDLSLKGPDGMTALHLAAKEGNVEACRLLVTSSRTTFAHIDSVDEGGWTPLVWAAEHGHAIVIRYLLENNADPFISDSQQNIVLHWAALNGSSKITEMLLDRGCHVNVMNVNGDTPLHIAARYSNYQCALILITRGARVNCLNCTGETPLDSCEVVDGECYNLIKVNASLQKIFPNKDKGIILTNDISKGKELNPIQCINSVDSSTEPKDFTYVTNVYVSSNNVQINRQLQDLMGCECNEKCQGSNCNCGNLSSKCCYDDEGKLAEDFDFEDPPMIFECNERCSCNKITCLNRVVQRGITSRLELFRSVNCGWAVRTLKEIKRGSFVSEYMGEILTDFDAKRRNIDSYLFDIYHSSEETYCLDGNHYGNISRFINHMCVPNLTPIRVFTDHQDIKFPRIGFFANKDIEAGEELGFDYGDKFWIAKQSEFTCQCGNELCRYSIDTIADTLEHYSKKESDD